MVKLAVIHFKMDLNMVIMFQSFVKLMANMNVLFITTVNFIYQSYIKVKP